MFGIVWSQIQEFKLTKQNGNGFEIKAIFDRDGVLVKSMIKDRKPYAVQKIKDFKIYKQAKKLIKKMNDKGFKTFVITNQQM